MPVLTTAKCGHCGGAIMGGQESDGKTWMTVYTCANCGRFWDGQGKARDSQEAPRCDSGAVDGVALDIDIPEAGNQQEGEMASSNGHKPAAEVPAAVAADEEPQESEVPAKREFDRVGGSNWPDASKDFVFALAEQNPELSDRKFCRLVAGLSNLPSGTVAAWRKNWRRRGLIPPTGHMWLPGRKDGGRPVGSKTQRQDEAEAAKPAVYSAFPGVALALIAAAQGRPIIQLVVSDTEILLQTELAYIPR